MLVELNKGNPFFFNPIPICLVRSLSLSAPSSHHITLSHLLCYPFFFNVEMCCITVSSLFHTLFLISMGSFYMEKKA